MEKKMENEIYRGYLCSILFGDTMVPIKELIFSFWGIVFLYKEYSLTGFNHQKRPYAFRDYGIQGFYNIRIR